MFDMLASKLEGARASNVHKHNTAARSRDEQERDRKSADESLLLLQDSRDDHAHLPSLDGDGPLKDSEAAGRGLGDTDIPSQGQPGGESLGCDASSTDGTSNEGTGGGEKSPVSFASSKNEDGDNSEGEFDPILASIRETPQQRATAAAAAAPSSPGGGVQRSNDSNVALSLEIDGSQGAKPTTGTGSTTFATGLFSMSSGGNVPASAGKVVTQSSAQVSKPSRKAPKKRLASDPPSATAAVDGISDLEEGLEGSGGGRGARRSSVLDATECPDDARLVCVNQMLTEEEREEINASSGQGEKLCLCFRMPTLTPTAVGLAILGIVFLWRWTVLTVSGEGNEMSRLDAATD